jgi:hypothetical protein
MKRDEMLAMVQDQVALQLDALRQQVESIRDALNMNPSRVNDD